MESYKSEAIIPNQPQRSLGLQIYQYVLFLCTVLVLLKSSLQDQAHTMATAMKVGIRQQTVQIDRGLQDGRFGGQLPQKLTTTRQRILNII